MLRPHTLALRLNTLIRTLTSDLPTASTWMKRHTTPVLMVTRDISRSLSWRYTGRYPDPNHRRIVRTPTPSPGVPLREAALAGSRNCFHRIIRSTDNSPFTCSMTTSPAATETNSILSPCARDHTDHNVEAGRGPKRGRGGGKGT